MRSGIGNLLMVMRGGYLYRLRMENGKVVDIDYSKLFRGVYIHSIIAFGFGVFGRGWLVKGFERL